jgi:hypothetical protein
MYSENYYPIPNITLPLDFTPPPGLPHPPGLLHPSTLVYTHDLQFVSYNEHIQKSSRQRYGRKARIREELLLIS